MNEKCEKLLKQINLNEEYFSYFDNASLDKIIGNTNKDSYIFMMSVDNILPLNVYEEMCNGLKNAFLGVPKKEFCFDVKNINYVLLIDYYKYFINKLCEKNHLFSSLDDAEITADNNKLNVSVSNTAEKNLLLNALDVLIKKLKNIGFKDVEINVDIVKREETIKEDIAYVSEDRLKHLGDTQEPQEKFKPQFKRKEIETVDDPDVLLGRVIDTTVSRLDEVYEPVNSVTIEASIFGTDIRETKTDLVIMTLKLTDGTDSIYAKIFTNDQERLSILKKNLKEGNWYKFRGSVKDDKYSNELSLNITDINYSKKEIVEVIDDAPVKRVELHAHTMMSQMDGLVEAKTLLKTAKKWGHRAIAITDHNGCQAFPDVYHFVCDVNKGLEEGKEPFKAIYGTELTMIDDTVKIVVRPTDDSLMDNTYVVFDLETTGFNAGGGDSIIEIGAVKIKNGEIIDKFDELINPGHKLNERIVEVTSITDDMLKDKDNEENAMKRFIEWTGDAPMVAHNAKFDTSFVEMAYQKYNFGEFKNTVIDTLELSRTMDTNFARHSLSALVKRYDVPFDEESHHRGDYDAEATALVFHKMLVKLDGRNFEKISDLDKLVSKDDIHKFGRQHHVNILVKNKEGLKNLFKLISLANTKYMYKTPRILRSVINEHRNGLLIGSGCYESEVFTEAKSKSDEELTNIINFYDYVEVQPPEVYSHLLESGDFTSEAEIIQNIEKVVRVSKNAGKIVVATGDVHHLKREDKIYRQIIVNQKVPGGGRHPLARNGVKNIPSQHFRTTREMLDDFAFLGDDLSYEIVVENTNKIADMIDIIEVIIETGGVPFSPRVKADDGKSYLDCPKVVTELVYTKALEWYGDPLPYNIEERIAKELYGDIVFTAVKYNLAKEITDEEELKVKSFEMLHDTILKGIDYVKSYVLAYIKETTEEELDEKGFEKKLKKMLGGIIGGGFDPIYLIAQRLVKHSNDEGFLVGSRGSVGSSFVATMMGITEVNPLPAHYRCLKCKTSVFKDDEGNELGATYSSGFDLPNKKCPNCGEEMYKDGQDMPFATFLGFNADKVPDIDLNFSDLNQASAHEYTKVLFGVDNVYRAGTIGTVADKTAFGFVKGYCEDNNIVMRTAEIERLAIGCTGVKRTTGQHPGGIVVIPDYMDVFDFTPFQFPADDPTSAWRTTHFDYHAIDQDVLKLDILGHSDPTQLRMIQDLTKMDVTTVPLDDKETMGIFLSPKPLGVTKEQIMCETGTLGIPEFGTKFTLQMLADTKPTTFSELIKISGLSHGTDVWLGNAQELIRNNIVPFKDVIGCRDDIMVYLMYNGVEPLKAFKIMEFVRKGKASKDPETWAGFVEIMEKANIPKWFIDSCQKIKYMFPKAHAAAYVISAFRIAWYKVHMPVYYYASWLTSKATDFDVDSMIKGYDAIKNKLVEITEKGNDATNKEAGIYESLHVCLEATARGIKFLPVNLYESEATTFKVKSDTEIYPPFNSIDGLGDTVAKNIVEERNKKSFLSIEEVQKRAKISGTLMDKMRLMGMFDGMEESNQMSLF